MATVQQPGGGVEALECVALLERDRNEDLLTTWYIIIIIIIIIITFIK